MTSPSTPDQVAQPPMRYYVSFEVETVMTLQQLQDAVFALNRWGPLRNLTISLSNIPK
jgi:hypothetical protein